MGSLRLTTTLQARGPAAAVVLDDEQVAAIGEGAKRFPVAATIDGLAFTHRKEFARWVAEAKKDETRDRRVAQALEMLREGRTRS